MKNNERVYKMAFASVYPHYVVKAEKKGKTKMDLDRVICWLTGYSFEQLHSQIEKRVDLETFFEEAPRMNPEAENIKGVICGVRIEEIEEDLMRKIRYMDKVVEDIAKKGTQTRIQG